MKTNLFKLLSFSVFYLLVLNLSAQTWTQKANFPGGTREYVAGFTIGHYGFIGLGHNGATTYNDFYEWNQTNNTWKGIANYPGSGRYSAVACAIEGKAYVGMGYTGSNAVTDFWMYDTTSNTWVSKATFPGTKRYDAAWFVLGHKLYVIGGSDGGTPYLSDDWVYDAHANTWKALSGSPTTSTDGMVCFAIGNHGYVGGGWNGTSAQTACYEYDSTTDSWTSIVSFPVPIGGDARTFVLGSKAYVCTGSNNTNTLSAGYVYDTATKAWAEFTNMGGNGIERGYAAAFTIGNYGYIGAGRDSLGGDLTDFWQYTPCDTGSPTAVNIITEIQNVAVKVYPNPSNGVFYLSYNGLNDKQGQVRIMDMFGRVVKSYDIEGREGIMKMDESILSNGMYFYQVISSDIIISTGKFLINK